MVELEPEPALFLDEDLSDRAARRDADKAMFAQVPKRETVITSSTAATTPTS